MQNIENFLKMSELSQAGQNLFIHQNIEVRGTQLQTQEAFSNKSGKSLNLSETYFHAEQVCYTARFKKA